MGAKPESQTFDLNDPKQWAKFSRTKCTDFEECGMGTPYHCFLCNSPNTGECYCNYFTCYKRKKTQFVII